MRQSENLDYNAVGNPNWYTLVFLRVISPIDPNFLTEFLAHPTFDGRNPAADI